MSAKAVFAFLVGLLAFGVFPAAAAATRYLDVALVEAAAAVPAGGLLALLALSLARRVRIENQRTLGRSGGTGLAGLGRALAILALLLAITAALAVGVFLALVLVLE